MASNIEPLPGSERAAPVGMRAIGAVEAHERITISVYLKSRDEVVGGSRLEARAALRQAREVSHREDIDAVAAFAQENGLDLVETDSARRLVRLAGSAAALEQAFGTKLTRYDTDGREHRVRTGPLHLPAPLIGRVLAVLGLDTRPVASPKFIRAHAATTSGFLATQVAELYGFADSRADGECVGIVELGGGYSDSDNAAAFAAMGLPVPQITAVPVDGAANSPGGDADGEVVLDIQVVGGAAPGASIAVYFARNTNQGFVDVISQAVHDDTHRPSAVSIS